MEKNQQPIGCGPGTPVEKPLFELRHLVAMLERQEQEKKRREKGGDPC